MAKKSAQKKRKEIKTDSYINNIPLIVGITLILVSLMFVISFFSFLINWEADQSQLCEFLDSNYKVKNTLGKVGGAIGHFFIYNLFGIASFIIAYVIGKIGLVYSMKLNKSNLIKSSVKNFGLVLWVSVATAFIFDGTPILGGVFGFEVKTITSAYVGGWGVGILLLFSLLTWIVFKYDITPQLINEKFTKSKDKYKAKVHERELRKEEVIKENASLAEIENAKAIKKESESEMVAEVKVVKEKVAVAESVAVTESVAVGDEIAEPKEDDIFEIALKGSGQYSTRKNYDNGEDVEFTTTSTATVETKEYDAFDDIPECDIKKEKTKAEVKVKPKAEKQDILELTNIEITEEEKVIEEKVTETKTTAKVEEKVEENVNEDGSLDLSTDFKPTDKEVVEDDEELEIDVHEPEKEEHLTKNLAESLVEQFGEYDPELDLPGFKYPEIDMLVDHGGGNIEINREELEENKNKIVETLNNYKIEISKIKATVGPTVTLYEIIPAPGVRISKIKNLEDDIALSLSALGIRIIAPIPGKGTIGIEVPSTSPSIVSMKSVISSSVFQKSEMILPIAFGKTISNTTFVVDLAKMPHLLVAGATGQGKSVGLNAIMTSLLYKKHPSELKFVLVDPKKVELTLFNKIERHYLAKLPGEESAIITDTSKVVNTLNSMCIEMDDRYELLKNAMTRNIVEYNNKFRKRKLNPEEGHKFLPYIVLVIDEFADLIMTAGKEVETPIARLAQLARAIGIHLIVATQRPSVNVITGIIKANFPARLAFRVTSKIDSRTILDAGGANQLIGRGDMLFTNGNEMVRLQCAFVDTPEVEIITDFIGNQKGYPDAFLLPEYVGDENSGTENIDIDDRDAKFEEAARIIVLAQQGSASLLQRKLKLGYNRAGRIVDQLEAAHIIGPFEGSKARQVLVPDEMALDQLLRGEKAARG
ncbi:MAG: DNA translocase FtsK 4TM domain-containing protein [Ichthyobacteriaceae bacterium]|nr:DNA translocase FtsK 4TM domain-containing protein [Ichthyobacteriaceae bacterium]